MPERGADPTEIEVEWQLDALDLRAVERWLAAFPRVVPSSGDAPSLVIQATSQPVVRTVDLYLDTDDWRVGRSGHVLRVRHSDQGGEVTLKDTSKAVEGLRRRLEVTEPLPPGGLEALTGEGPVGRRLRTLIGEAHLIHILEVRTRRHPIHLQSGEHGIGEIDLDDTIIVVGDDQYPVRMRRVEIEVESAWVELLTPLVDQLRHDCSLQPALLSKFEVGLLAAGLTIPTIPDLGPTALGRNPTIGALTVAVLRRHVAAMLTHEAGTRLGEDIEELHDMRVATRRLRAALALFDEFLPEESDHLREELGWLADELGAVRDLDVQISRLDGWREELSSTHGATLADLGRLLERERDKIREGLLASLDSPRYERLVARFIDLVSPGIGHASERARSDAEQPATTVVPELVTARYRAVTAAARRARRSGDPADLHRLRIRTKRLRYALEFVSDIYGKRTKRLTRQMVQLQDCLGIIQDAEVAADRLHTLALRSDGGLSPATVFAMGGVAERYRRDAATAVDAVPGHLRALKGRDWHTLEKYMERKRDRGGEVCEEPEAGGPESGTGPAAHRGAGVDRTGPWGPRSATALLGSTPRSIADPPDDGEWDRADTQVLRSLPDPTGPEDETPDPGENHPPPLFQSPDLGAGDRRKEPVFLPSSARPGPGRPGSVPPTPPTEPPGRTDNRTFYDRP